MLTPLADFLLTIAAFVGHVAIWATAFNRMHATSLSCRKLRLLGKVIFIGLAIIPTLFAVSWLLANDRGTGFVARSWNSPWALSYLVICWFMAAASLLTWFVRRVTDQEEQLVASNNTTVIDSVQRIGSKPVTGVFHQMMAALPGNQILQISVHRKTLRLHRLPDALRGLRIAHLTDLHFTGHLKREYFDIVMQETNAFEPDLVAITGDIVDKDHCFEWIPETLGRLESRFGMYFVLGNHDRRVSDVERLRQVLADVGIVDVGGRRIEVEVKGYPMVIAGNERPWFNETPDMSGIVSSNGNPRAFRFLLAHTPDQIRWAQRHDFDLMLSGHNHGGQVRLPFLGPIVAPSRHGVKFASGVFMEHPTLLHVSRGISAVEPLRLNCRPELALLTLSSA